MQQAFLFTSSCLHGETQTTNKSQPFHVHIMLLLMLSILDFYPFFSLLLSHNFGANDTSTDLACP